MTVLLSVCVQLIGLVSEYTHVVRYYHRVVHCEGSIDSRSEVVILADALAQFYVMADGQSSQG